MFRFSDTRSVYPAAAMHSLHRWGSSTGLFAVLCVLAVAMAGFSGNAQPPLQAAEPDMVDQVTNLTASAAGQTIGDTASTVAAQDALAAPTGISAMETGSGQVTVSWDPVDNAQFYRVGWVAWDDYLAVTEDNRDWLEAFAFIDISNREQSSHQLSRLTPGAVYYFIVASNDERYGTPRWSRWSERLTLSAAPATEAPTGSASINLTWEEVPGAAYYRIGWVVYSDVQPIIAAGGDWLEHFAFIDIANRGQTEHTIGRLTPGLRYAFIVAGNDGRYGTPQWPPASAWQFLTPSAGPPVPEPSTDANTDRATLVALYNATGGPSWTDNTNWLTDAPIGEWHGVTTGNGGRVTELELHENGLTGRMPSELGNLANLTILRLYENDLIGELPASLGNLSNLEILSLGGNQFTGTVPSWDNLSNLKELYLWGSELTGPVPPWLGDISSLEVISLSDGSLTGTIPSNLGNLSNLAHLRLHNNRLTGHIPSSLETLSNLTDLGLHNNRLTGPIPAWVGNLTNLEELNLSGNQFTPGPIPSTFANLSNLRELYLWRSNLTGPIPSWLGNLTNLARMNLRDNQLTGPVPTWLGGLTNLESLGLGGNRLMGEIPEELGNLHNLQRLSLRENQLNGPIPSAFGNLHNLTYLSLRDNQLIGPVASRLSDLQKLTYLSLRNNQLTG